MHDCMRVVGLFCCVDVNLWVLERCCCGCDVGGSVFVCLFD